MMSGGKENANATDSQIRDSLVNTAVHFLLNPDVSKRHDDSKINFLKKKGLTDAEISAAFEKIKLDSEYVNTLVPSDQMNTFYQQANTFHHHPIPYQTYSFWSRLSGLSSSLIVFGVAVYGLHHMYKKFIRPWLVGEDAEIDCSLNNLKELTKNLAMLTETVEQLHATVTKQNDEINKLLNIEGFGYAPTFVSLEDLKREVGSLKSILISRHQFPAMPQMQAIKPTIPSWQLSQAQSVDEDMASAKLQTGDTAQEIEDNISSLNEESLKISDGSLS